MKPQMTIRCLGLVGWLTWTQLEAAHAQQLVAEVGLGSVSSGIQGPVVGVRGHVPLATAVDLQFVGAVGRYELPATSDGTILAAPLVETTASLGLSYHLDELPVVPFLAFGPEISAETYLGDTNAQTRLRLSIGADWHVRAPWVVSLAAHYHYQPSAFPSSDRLAGMLGFGFHWGR